jgi:6-pyruvoyltetrahydropterin/6-carboxytetrahydropterin synthase
MYTLRVARDFVAQHYLTVPDCGPENEWHSHHFEIELILEGPSLNEHGYVVDIVEVEDLLESRVDRYRDATLNDLPEFDDKNPSIEHFSRIISDYIKRHINTEPVETITVRIWEDDSAWASYTVDC